MEKWVFRAKKVVISLKCGKIGQKLLLTAYIFIYDVTPERDLSFFCTDLRANHFLILFIYFLCGHVTCP